MATTSFNKDFIVNDPNSVVSILKSLEEEKPNHFELSQRNQEEENKRGLALLKRKLSNLQQS